MQRYKRFLADVRLEDGSLVTAHCANSGSMLGCSAPHSRVLLSHSDSPRRKLPWTLQLLEVNGGWVSVNTLLSNRVVEEAMVRGDLAGFDGYGQVRREVRYGKGSRVDLLLEGARGRCYVEVKSVNLVHRQVAYFPDAVTTRGTRHLEELAGVVSPTATPSVRAVLFYLVCREDADRVRPADRIDAVYGQTLRRVAQAGVEVVAWRCAVSPTGLELATPLPVDLGPPQDHWAW